MKKIIRLCLVIPAAVFLFTSIAVAAPGAEKPLTAKKSENYSVSVSKIQNSKKEKIRLFSNSGEEKVM